MTWAKPRRVADNTAMTNPARLEPVSVPPDLQDESLSDVRMEKVEKLRAAIADGSYRVSTEALADKLMDHMRELGASRRGKRRR